MQQKTLFSTRKKNPAKRRKTTTKGRRTMAGRKRTRRTTRKRATARRRTYRTRPRRRNVMSSRRRTYMPARSNPRKRRRTRRNATAGSRHRLTVYKRRGRLYAPRGPRAEELAMLRPGTRINKRRRRRRSNPRRGFIKTLTSRRMIMSGLKIGGGITGGFLAMPLVYSMLPVTFRTGNRRWLGIGHVGIGALMVGMLRNKDAKDVGMIVAGTGIYDLIANNIPALGLPPLPVTMPEMFGGATALEAPESTSASYPVLSAPVSDVARRGIGASYEQSYSRAGSGLLGSNYEEPDEIEEMFSDY